MKDTLISLYQPESGSLNVPYQPASTSEIIENPPRFTWMPAKLEDDCYVLEIAKNPTFQAEETHTYKPIHNNFFTPDQPLEQGVYFWRYALICNEDYDSQLSDWSEVRSFELKPDLPETPLPNRSDRYNQVNLARPRLWLTEEELHQFTFEVKKNSQSCNFDVFYERSVKPFLDLPLTKEPEPYPNNQRVAKLWRKMYMDCQEALYAIRHLSVAGVILQDEEIIQKAKEWLLHVSAWDPEGTTSRDYNDEGAFRIAGALAWGYDWLYSYLSDDERTEVKEQLFIRTEQVAFHVMERSKIHHVPYDSHAVRSLSSVLVPCCIALFEEEPKAREWLDYTLEYYSGLYTPWGGAEGGWAEGPHYWLTGMAYVIDAMNLVKKFNGYNLYTRPFFQKTGDFPLFVYPPDTNRASFGDHANLGDQPGLKVGFNIRQFAGVTGNPYYQWYYEQTKKYDVKPDEKFYNKGWWDFYFDEMMYLHDYPEIEAKEPTDLPTVKWFKDVGWVAMHHRMDAPDDHIMYLTKASHYGSISHSHGDQNAFVLHAYGDPLAIHSGYYVAFNSTMHMKWRRQTISKNTILIDGKGQYAEKDKFIGIKANGTIETVEDHDDYSYVRGDATNAYQQYVPYLKRYVRETYFINNSYFVLIDTIDLTQEGKVDWLLHTLNEMTLKHQSFAVEGEKAALEGRFVYCSSGELTLNQHNDFPGVDLTELEGAPVHWRLQAQTNSAKRHRIVTLLHPMKKTKPKYVSYFMDDQDHGLQFYFTEDGKTFRVEVPKIY
ncbi:DUF4962 domain-containing protein [Halalkalibacter okhensis]|uniref:Alginate lyase n=1 Tax=Halalkalibacter okhensis TaxID=333138 RepID=A0A0B0IMP3_9BACI|nr:DUF4962 domain-containing protein [Halalkalibacter okhensis]KHF41324.1 alginate lyase [Halalkalibacter okhensis]